MPTNTDIWPFATVYIFMFMVVFLRASGTYWLARLVTGWSLTHTTPTKAWAIRAHEWLDRQGTGRGVRAIEKWGLVALPLCFLTVGFQTMVLCGAGILRIHWLRFTLAIIPGCLAWAAIYSTIGFAAWNAVIAAATGSWWAIATLTLIAVIVTVVIVMRVRRKRELAAMAECESAADVAAHVDA